MARPHSLHQAIKLQREIDKYENWLSQGLTTLAQLPNDVRAYVLAKKHGSREFWFELLAQLDFYDAKILHHVYEAQEGATTLLLIVRHLRHVGIKREAIRQRVLALANLGLLEVIPKTKPLCICGRIELEAKVMSLVHGVYERLGVMRK